MEKIQLKVYGITHSEIQSGAYALMLSEIDGNRYIPIVVGTAEAQSIAAFLEKVQPPRPLTHDLFVSVAHAFSLSLDEVYIYKFENGVFYSELLLSDDTKQIAVNSRTSDAIAIALRTGSSIFTTPEVIDATGIIIDNNRGELNVSKTRDAEKQLDSLSLDRLTELMNKAADEENYELAAKIKHVIDVRRNTLNSE